MLIIWDTDDVLNKLMDSWLTSWQQESSNDAVKFSELTQNPPHKILGIDLETYYSSLDGFRNSAKARELKPNQSLLKWFSKYGSRHNHIALTARPLNTMSNQAWWIYNNFGQWIHTVAVVPALRDSKSKQRLKNKTQYIQWLGKGDIFVDDNAENVAEVAKLGLKTFLFPQPWNENNQSEAEFIEEFTMELQ